MSHLTTCAALLAVACLPRLTAALEPPTRPNIVFIIADDLTHRDLGCYGGQAATPHMDKLSSESMKFTHCFQAAPMCSPTRHNIYTGLYPVASGAYPNHTFVRAGVKSVTQYLKPLGYRVALSGKQHIGPKPVFDFEFSGKKNPDMQAIAKLFQECAAAETPFCLFACSNEPHSPWNKGDASAYPPGKLTLPKYFVDTPVVREHFSRYLAEITYFDQQVGDILSLLDEHGLAQDTLVMVVSEQGNSFPFAKWTCYDQGLQSGMLVRWPGVVEPGSTTDALVEYVDILPTFLEAVGAKPVTDLHGKSFADVLKGVTDHHKDYVYGEMTTRGIINGSDLYAIRSVRDNRYRLIWNVHHETTFTNACTQAAYFQSMVEVAQSGNPRARELVTKYQHRPEYELYDCVSDPDQMNNLYGQTELADTAQRLTNQLETWLEEMGDDPKRSEAEALLHQGAYKGLTLEQADRRYEQKQKR